MFPVVAFVLTQLADAANLFVNFSFVVFLYPPLFHLLCIFCLGGFIDFNNLFSCCPSGGLFDCFIFTTGGSAYVSSPFSLFRLCSQGGRDVIVSLSKGVSLK